MLGQTSTLRLQQSYYTSILPIYLTGRWPTGGALCWSTPKQNGKSGTAYTSQLILEIVVLSCVLHIFLLLLLTRKLLNQCVLVFKLMSSLRKFYDHHHDFDNHYGISMSQMSIRYVPFAVVTIQPFPHSWVPEFVTRVTRRVL